MKRQEIKKYIDQVVGTEGNLRIPAWWMNKILSDITELSIQNKENILDVEKVIELLEKQLNFTKIELTDEIEGVKTDLTITKGGGSNSALQTPKGETFTDKNKYSLTTLQEVPADASGDYSVVLNGTAAATADQAVAQGHRCIARGETSHSEGHCAVVDYIDEVQNGYGSHAEGYGTYVIGTYSHAEGSETAISGNNSHAEGGSTIIEGDFAHAEGYGSFVGDRDNAPKFEIPEGGEGEGGNVTPGPDVTGKKGVAAHAEGNYTIAEGKCQY